MDNGSMGSARVEPHRGIVVATPVGDGFVDPVSIQVSSEPLGNTESSLPAGAELSFPVAASEPRGDLWLSAVVNLPWVQQALGSVEVAEDASLTLGAGSPMTVLETFDSPDPYELHSTYFEVTSDGNDVVVETATVAAPLVIPTAGGDTRLERDTVQGQGCVASLADRCGRRVARAGLASRTVPGRLRQRACSARRGSRGRREPRRGRGGGMGRRDRL